MPSERKLNDMARGALIAWSNTRPANYLEADPNFQRVLQMYLGEAYHAHWPQLNRTASLAAGRMKDLADVLSRDENMPTLRNFTAFGEHIEEVIFHPAYFELGALTWSTGVLTILQHPGNDLISAAHFYFISHNGETGHACPVACTAGLTKLIQTAGSEEQRAHYLPQLLQTDFSRRLHASQFITEVQGGSDVGTNVCLAQHDRETDLYRISGEKWFCSVADASLFVVSARPDGALSGTRGLGLFLVPRLINGQVNNFTLRRLKPKLGTRALPTAEIDFHESLAEPIGTLDSGFKHLVSIVLDTSRVYNAVSCCGLMHRAFIEAQTFAQYRHAFGVVLMDLPMVQMLLAQMKTLCWAALSITFRQLALSDRIVAESGSVDGLKGTRRIQVMLNKYWTARLCSDVVRMGIEVLGGNGTIEDFSVLPRLYRDAIVLESWEGTHNTLCAQVLKDFNRHGLHLPWLADLQQAVDALTHEQVQPRKERALVLLQDLRRRLDLLLSGDPASASLHIRHIVDRMSAVSTYISLLTELDWELGHGLDTDKPLIVDLFDQLYLERLLPLDIPNLPKIVRRLALTF